MTSAQALSALPYAQPLSSRKEPLRLLRSDAAPHEFALVATPTGKPPPRTGTELALWVLLVAGIHAAVVTSVWNHPTQPRERQAPQEIELLRPAPVVPEPPRVEPPKPVEPPKHALAPAPPAALRTSVAQAPQPDTMAVTENLTAPKTAGPVAAVPTAPPARVEEPVTEPTGYAGYLNNPAPQYPKAALRMGMQGRVVLRVRVLASGHVGEVEIKQSSGKELLDEAALTAVRGWTFAPAKRGNTPIDAWSQVPIDFKLAQ
jgi:protein TonB